MHFLFKMFNILELLEYGMANKSPITIEVLETLDAIERRGSFAKAAEELNKATSAISYIVQKLEEQLDIAVFQRQGRRSVLTPAGRLVLEEGSPAYALPWNPCSLIRFFSMCLQLFSRSTPASRLMCANVC